MAHVSVCFSYCLMISLLYHNAVFFTSEAIIMSTLRLVVTFGHLNFIAATIFLKEMSTSLKVLEVSFT